MSRSKSRERLTHVQKVSLFALLPLTLTLTGAAHATTPQIRVVVIDPQTHQPVPNAYLRIEEIGNKSGPNKPQLFHRTNATGAAVIGLAVNTSDTAETTSLLQTITVPLETTVTVLEAAPVPAQQTPQTPPIKDIYVKVTASRLPIAKAGVTAAAAVRTKSDLQTFTNKTSGNASALTQGQSGVASDSNGQQHIRGEHADIAFVVDGVPLPDTLSGRQGSVVAPSTIESLDILTGGFAPEFGGQTAAVLNISTLPGVKKATNDLTFQGGGYNTFNNNFAAAGPLSKRGSYTLNINTTRSDNALEPQQPDNQTAHNNGHDESYFAKFGFTPSSKDSLSMTLSRAPSFLNLSNRTGLSDRYASAGQGYGFLGLRNSDGTRPDVTDENRDALGAQTLLLPSQQDERQDIFQNEVNEFGTLTYHRNLSTKDTLQVAGVFLHSSQDVRNNNPGVDLQNLPVDNSIEYNPTAKRNVYHSQINASLAAHRGIHEFKIGYLNDGQHGDESYQLIPGSQLALNELASLSPALAPAGTVQMGAQNNPVLDVNGNPVYTPNAGATSPTLQVHRSGFYEAAYVQDTWTPGHLTANYGIRYDRYRQGQNLGQPNIDNKYFSPRINLSYALSPPTRLRLSYNKLMNVPPLAQGAVVGQPIQPETLSQYDASVEHQVKPGQSAKIAYYYKQISNQVDTGLLIPGSQIGLYSAVNLQYGGVHGIETSYDFSPLHGVGWDGFVNYTYSIARPNGVDNTGAPVPLYNDHDQRHTVGAGLAYLWKGGATAAMTLNYGSGLASSPIPPSESRISRTQVDLRLASSPHALGNHGGLGLDVTNLFDTRSVINFQSAFSGTRFQQGRRILLSLFGNF
jgi:outer membrane receptor protein involved in Fe transport